jgi:DNA-binding response OmpR family regulator
MARYRVLIVDAHAETRAALALAFSKSRCSPLSAASLAQGLAMLDSRPDCVVLDLVLPDGEGETLLRTVREAEPGGSPPVLAVLTVETNANRLGDVAKLRPELLLLKPMDPEAVARLCVSEMDGREDSGHEQH